MIHIFKDKKPTLEEAQSLVDGYVEMVRSPIHENIQKTCPNWTKGALVGPMGMGPQTVP